MANAYRGDVGVCLGQKTCTARLTLNALARLETLLDAPDLTALIAVLVSPNISMRTVSAVLCEALMAGSNLSQNEAQKALDEADPMALTRAYVALIRLTFLSDQISADHV